MRPIRPKDFRSIPSASIGSRSINADALRRSLQLGFQVQNDIAEQTRRERIGGLPLHRSIARHLISALLQSLAVSHGEVPHALTPSAGALVHPIGELLRRRNGNQRARDASPPSDSSDQGSIGGAIAAFACNGAIIKSNSFCTKFPSPEGSLLEYGGGKFALGAACSAIRRQANRRL